MKLVRLTSETKRVDPTGTPNRKVPKSRYVVEQVELHAVLNSKLGALSLSHRYMGTSQLGDR